MKFGHNLSCVNIFGAIRQIFEFQSQSWENKLFFSNLFKNHVFFAISQVLNRNSKIRLMAPKVFTHLSFRYLSWGYNVYKYVRSYRIWSCFPFSSFASSFESPAVGFGRGRPKRIQHLWAQLSPQKDLHAHDPKISLSLANFWCFLFFFFMFLCVILVGFYLFFIFFLWALFLCLSLSVCHW